MSFSSLNKPELQEVADFFTIEVTAADPEKGATKDELLAALAAGDDPVTWEKDYKETFLEAKKAGTDKSQAQKRDEAIAESIEKAKEAEEKSDSENVVTFDEEPEDNSEKVLVRYDRENPVYEVGNYIFYKDHPFQLVPKDFADSLITNGEGFRVATSQEVADYYN